MSSGSGARAQWVREIAPVLWPVPERIDRQPPETSPRAGERDFGLFPSVGDPRLVVPLESRAAAAAVLQRWASEGSAARRLGGQGLAFAVRAGGARAVLRGRFRVSSPGSCRGGIDGYLAQITGEQLLPVLLVTRPRANRKPVLELMDATGRVVAYAKVGVDPLTRSLVTREAAALRIVAAAGLRHVRTPKVWHHGSFGDLEVLVLTPLPLSGASQTTKPEALTAGMAEVARVGGLREHALEQTAYRRELGAAVERLPTAVRGELQAALHRADDCSRGRRLWFGAWHGDWATWNSSSRGGELLVWDWERFATGVPLGYDAIHHALHQLVLDPSRDTTGLVTSYAGTVAPLLERMGVDRDAVALTTVLYLIEITTRYLADGQDDVAGMRTILSGLVNGTLAAAQALDQPAPSAGGGR